MMISSDPVEVLTDLETDTLLAGTRRRADDLRDHLLFAIPLGTGLRVSELVGLEMRDVKSGKGAREVIPVRAEIAKFKKARVVPVPRKLRRKIATYFTWKRDCFEGMGPRDPLFASRGGGRGGATRGSQLSAKRAQDIFALWQKRLGFDRTANFHMLRHTFATNFLRSGGSVHELQRILGHSSLAVTTIYLHPSLQDLINATRDFDRC
jgi:site-specific recombinase XerD